jgi:hydroxypyruvate isomerase
LEQIAPYAVNAQLKVEMFPNGKREEADIARILSILRTANYSGWVALEYEAEEPPLTAIPKWLEAIKKLIG